MMNSFRYGVIRFFRSYLTPIDPAVATKWYNRLRVIYIVGAFHVVGATIYVVQKDKFRSKGYEVEEKYSDKYIRNMRLENVMVINANFRGVQSHYQTDAAELKAKYEEKKAKVLEKYIV